MFSLSQGRRLRRCSTIAYAALWGSPLLAISAFFAVPASAQTNSLADNPATVPAGAIPPLPAKHPTTTNAPAQSPKQIRAADDAYLEGAKHIEHKELAAALRSFQQAVRLNPNDSDYSLALIVTREDYVTELVQRAAQARSVGDNSLSDSLLAQARTLDPNNHVVLQHFETMSGSGNKIASDEKKPARFIRVSTPPNSLPKT